MEGCKQHGVGARTWSSRLSCTALCCLICRLGANSRTYTPCWVLGVQDTKLGSPPSLCRERGRRETWVVILQENKAAGRPGERRCLPPERCQSRQEGQPGGGSAGTVRWRRLQGRVPQCTGRWWEGRGRGKSLKVGGVPWSSRVTAHNRAEGGVGEDSETCCFHVRNDSPELGRLLTGGWGESRGPEMGWEEGRSRGRHPGWLPGSSLGVTSQGD